VATTTLGRLPTVVLAPVGRVEDNKALGQESTLEARQTSRVPTQPAKRSRQNASLVETSSACWIRSASPFENPTPCSTSSLGGISRFAALSVQVRKALAKYKACTPMSSSASARRSITLWCLSSSRSFLYPALFLNLPLKNSLLLLSHSTKIEGGDGPNLRHNNTCHDRCEKRVHLLHLKRVLTMNPDSRLF